MLTMSFKKDPQFKHKMIVLDLLYKDLLEQDYFNSIVQYMITEVLKSNKDKTDSVLNLTLIMSGNTGVGKSSFVEFMLKPLFSCVAVDLTAQFQSTKILSDSVKVLYSSNDDRIKDFYPLSLVPNGDIPLNVKYSEQSWKSKMKSMIILTNYNQ